MTLQFIGTNVLFDLYGQVGRESDLSILEHIDHHHDRIRRVNRTGFLGQRCRQPEFDRTGGTSDVPIGGKMVSLDCQLLQLTILPGPRLPRDGRLVVE